MLLDNIVDSKNKLKILRELSQHKNWEYSVNELSKNTNIHRVRISNLIKKLQKLNVIKIRTKGRTKLISINKENILVKEILIKLFEKEQNLTRETAKELITKIKNYNNITSIILYGSAIKKSFTFKSDIDLMIIYTKKINKEKIEKIIEQYTNKGLLIFCDFITLNEFKKLHKQKEASIITLIKDHKVLYGKNILEII